MTATPSGAVSAKATTTFSMDEVITAADGGRTVDLRVGENIEIDAPTGAQLAAIAADLPGMLEPFPIPTPSGVLLFRVVYPGSGTLVVTGRCMKSPAHVSRYTVTVVATL